VNRANSLGVGKSRLPLRYSLRALLLLMLVAALCCAEFGRRLRRAQRQAPAVGFLKSLGATIAYDYQEVTLEKKYNVKRIVRGNSPYPEWLLRRLGVDFFHNVTQVHVEATRRLPDEVVERLWIAIRDLPDLEILDTGFVTRPGAIRALSRHRNLKALSLRCSAVADEDFAVLASLHRLEELILNDSPITDAGVSQISRISSLRRLELHFAKITDLGVESVAQLPNLERLRLSATAIGDVGVEYLREHPALTELDLHYTKITSAALDPIASIPNLSALDVAMTRIADEGVAHLAGHPRLRNLNLGSTDASGVGLDRLPALEDLCIGGNRSITDLSWLPGCRKLRRLSLATSLFVESPIDPSMIPPEMSELCLERTQMSDANVLALAEAPSVKIIRYPRYDFTDGTSPFRPRVLRTPRADCTLVPTESSERQGKEWYRQ
jgi:Leucine-rich repeat (LRR) protein